MARPSSLPELPRNNNDVWELNKDLEEIIENIEIVSVQLTWMAYDMVALRTSPELEASMRKLEETYHRCRAAVCEEPEEGTEKCSCPDPNTTTLTQI
uniref:synaptonemal complex central element protein 3 n=1 Tax=Scatophagus argus TaxID=75038 RepID=UPI001ED7F5D6|nr:synaptonemal complex central element protein 3 [Scatophagus argus]